MISEVTNALPRPRVRALGTRSARPVRKHATRDVLKYEAAIYEIERAVVELSEMRSPVDLKVATFWGPVLLACAGNHRWSDVDAANIIKIGCEGLGETPDATAKVEGTAGRQCRSAAGDSGHEPSDVSLACFEEVVNIPFRFSVGSGQDAP